MNGDKTSDSNEVKLVFTGSVPIGDHNEPFEIMATRDGLLVEETFTIPWDWVESARGKILTAVPVFEKE